MEDNILKIKYIPTNQLVMLEGNPRKADDDAVEKLADLIKHHGFLNPLQVFEESPGGPWTILCGNHRFLAGKTLGMWQFPCIEYNGTRDEAIARAISDNRASDWTKWDFPALKDMMADLDTGEFEIGEVCGFVAEDLNKMFDHEPVGRQVICPDCGKEFEG